MIIGRLPKKFQKFLKIAVQAVGNYAEWRSAFRFLAVAKGPLSDDDLLALTAFNGHPLEPELFESVPWDVYRWVARRQSSWAFQHPSIRKAYSDSYLREPVHGQIHGQLLEYCRGWQRSGSAYALEFFPGHLWDLRSLDELFRLALDPEFPRAQARRYPDRPDLSLNTLLLGIRAAAELDQIVPLAELVLRYAVRKEQLTRSNPLKALRSGDLERAWALIRLYEPDLSAVWTLLILVSLRDPPRPEVESVARALLRGDLAALPRLWDPAASVAVPLACALLRGGKPEDFELCARLFQDEGLRAICRSLTETGHFAPALRAGEAIENPSKGVAALNEIAAAQGLTDEGEPARRALEAALRRSEDITSPYELALALVGIATTWLGLGMTDVARAILTRALRAVRRIERGQWDRVRACIEIASRFSRAGAAPDTRRLLTAALRLARRFEVAESRIQAQIAISHLFAEIGQVEDGRKALAIALRAARGIRHLRTWWRPSRNSPSRMRMCIYSSCPRPMGKWSSTVATSRAWRLSISGW